MAKKKVSYNSIPDKHTDWGLDPTENLPYSGQSVQDYIKKQLDTKGSVFYHDDSNDRFLIFADEENKNLYLADSSKEELILGIIDLKAILVDINDLKLSYKEIESIIENAVNRIDTIELDTSKLRTEFLTTTERLDGTIQDNWSSINQTAEQIRLEVGELETDLEGKIYEANSAITQTAHQIRLEVNEKETALDGKIEENRTAINVTADNINLRVDEVERNAEGKVREAYSYIDQRADSITTKVSEVETDLSGRLTIAESKVTQTEKDITSLVQETTELGNAYSEVKQDVDGVVTRIGTIEGNVTDISTTVDGISASIGTVEGKIETLQKQADGAITTYFEEGEPTNDNYPAIEWITTSDKNNHLGDLYYDRFTGYAYRYTLDEARQEYYWNKITDTDITKALADAAKAQYTADGKSTTFIGDLSTESSSDLYYQIGDIWILPTDYYYSDNTVRYNEGTILVCVKSFNKVSFSWGDWEEKVKYTDDSKVEALNTYINLSFKDGILDNEEKNVIKTAKQAVEAQFLELQEEYNILIQASYKEEGTTNSLNAAFTEVGNKYIDLIYAVDEILNYEYKYDVEKDEEENSALHRQGLEEYRSLYNTAYTAFVAAVQTYRQKVESFREAINQNLNAANTYLFETASDGIISVVEKRQLLELQKSFISEFNANRGAAVNYKILLSELDTDEKGDRGDEYSFKFKDTYYNLYIKYRDAFEGVRALFDELEVNNLEKPTTLVETSSRDTIDRILNTYYDALKVFVEVLSETVALLEKAFEDSKKILDDLTSQLSIEDEITHVGKGVVLSTVIGVMSGAGGEGKQLVAGMNAAGDSETPNFYDSTHHRVLFAGGIPAEGINRGNWNYANFVVYEDGFIKATEANLYGDIRVGGHVILDGVIELTNTDGTSVNLNSYSEVYEAYSKLLDMFELTGDGETAPYIIEAKYPLLSKDFIASAASTSDGTGGSGGGGGEGSDDWKLDMWLSIAGDSDSFANYQVNPSHLTAYLTRAQIQETYATIADYTTLSGRVSLLEQSGGGGGDIPSLEGYATESWVSNNYLPLSGGTINSNTYEILVLDTSYAYGEAQIHLKVNGESKSLFGWSSTYGTMIYNTINGHVLGIKDDGTPHYSLNTLLHSGNYSSYALPLSGGTMTGTITIGSWTAFGVAGSNFYLGSPDYPLLLRSNGTTTINGNTLIHSGNVGDYALANYGNQGAIDFNDVLYNGFQYTSGSSSNKGFPYGILASFRNSDSAWQILGGRNHNRLMYRGGNGTSDTWGDWKTIAFTDSNVASATKLATARTIWGQSFDGTGDVDGDMNLQIGASAFGVGPKIYFNIANRGSVAMIQGKYDAVDWTATNPAAGSLLFTTYNHDESGVRMIINSSGNVGIGTTSPSEKLTVAGNLTTSGTISASGGTLTGGRGVYSPLTITNTNLSEVWIRFNDAVGGCNIGSSNGVPSIYTGNVNQTIIHSGNYSSYAVKYVGDSSVDNARHSIGYDDGSRGSANLPEGFSGGFISADDGDYGFQMFGAGSTHKLFFRPLFNGSFRDWSEIIHSGNIGSQSVSFASDAARLSSTWNIDCNVVSGDGVKIISTRSQQGNFAGGYQSGLSVMSDYVGWQLTSYGGGEQNPYFRSYQDNGTWKPWRLLAFLDDNVASATKLETGRYLWGNYFSGEQNISSALFLNSGGDGIYVDYNGINYHNSGNSWIATNINFQSDGGLWLSPYGGNVLIGTTTDGRGKLNIAANTNVSGGVGAIISATDTTSTTSYPRPFEAFYPNLPTGRFISLGFGVRDSARDAGFMAFTYAGQNSTSNRLSFGLHSVDDVLNITGGGNVLIGTTEGSLGMLQVVQDITILPHSGGYADMRFVMDKTQQECYVLSARGGDSGKPFKMYYSPSAKSGVYNELMSISTEGAMQIAKTLTIVSDAAYNSTTEGGELILMPPSAGNYVAHLDVYINQFRVWTEHKTTGATAAPLSLDMSTGNLVIAGNITASGEVTALGSSSSSDRRLKDIVSRPTPLLLEDIAKLNVISFKWNHRENDKRLKIGLVAQEVQEILPELVGVDRSNYLTLDYSTFGSIVGVMNTKKILSLEEFVEALVGRVEVLENENKELRRKIYG